MNTFSLLDPTQKDENGVIRFYSVSASIVDFRGNKRYSINIYSMEAKILEEKKDRVHYLFNGKLKRTIKKKELVKNDFGEVFGFNPYGIGSNMSCYKDEIDITIKLCIEDLWKKISTRDNVPEWVLDFKDSTPTLQGYDHA